MRKDILKIKKIILIKILFLLLFIFSACKKKEEIKEIDTSVFPDVFLGILNEKEIYVTSFGQSIDIEDITRELDNLNVDYNRDNYLKVDSINNDSAVIMVIGCSVKGLQESGTTIEKEIERANKIIKEKQNKNLTLIAFHIGGVARRGKSSDSLIKDIMTKTDFNVFYKLGNHDFYLSSLFEKENIKMYSYESPSQLNQTLKKMLELGDSND